jgi:hypothetical protein
MAVQDPTVTHAQLALEEAELIDAGPAVSWGAIIAGALAAAALSFVLLSIGAAFGLSVTSPWQFTGREAGEAAAAAGIGTAIFLVIVHALASGIGGYLAGRLRSKIIGVRGDETYFRDTAHGLVVWAVSALVTIVMIASLAFGAARGGLALGAAAGEAAGGAMAAAAEATTGEAGTGQDSIDYFVDWLFRPSAAPQGAAAQAPQGQTTTGQSTAQPTSPETGTMMAMPGPAEGNARIERDEVARIVRMSLDGQLSAEDRAYIAQLVARETGMSEAEAQQRVSQVIDRAKAAQVEAKQTARQAADVARRAGMYTSLWAAVTMLAGAFCASLAATWGGRARDL